MWEPIWFIYSPYRLLGRCSITTRHAWFWFFVQALFFQFYLFSELNMNFSAGNPIGFEPNTRFQFYPTVSATMMLMNFNAALLLCVEHGLCRIYIYSDAYLDKQLFNCLCVCWSAVILFVCWVLPLYKYMDFLFICVLCVQLKIWCWMGRFSRLFVI